jgi:hypothetical protein
MGATIPAFADLTKPIAEVFSGSARAGGAFAPGGESRLTLSEDRRISISYSVLRVAARSGASDRG